jgi:probable HAF family extracellular repeat protein
VLSPAGPAVRRPEAGERRRYDVIPLEVDGALHDVNDAMTAVGHDAAGGLRRALQIDQDGPRDLGTLGGSAAAARGINNAGAIVGGALTTGDLSHHAFLYEDGVMHDLNAFIEPGLGCELVQALGINDRGDIVAIGHWQGTDRVVLLKRRDD